jgi:hypothetical protein
MEKPTRPSEEGGLVVADEAGPPESAPGDNPRKRRSPQGWVVRWRGSTPPKVLVG